MWFGPLERSAALPPQIAGGRFLRPTTQAHPDRSALPCAYSSPDGREGLLLWGRPLFFATIGGLTAPLAQAEVNNSMQRIIRFGGSSARRFTVSNTVWASNVLSKDKLAYLCAPGEDGTKSPRSLS